MMIRGIYKLPAIKHAFFIVDSLEEFSDNLPGSQENKLRMEYFEHIVLSKDRICPKEIQQWTLKVVSESDFVKVIEQHSPKGLVSSNQTYRSPEYLELLAINLLKTSDTSDGTFHTPKVLSSIPDEDVIEVFI